MQNTLYLEHSLPQIQNVHLVKSVTIYGMQKLHWQMLFTIRHKMCLLLYWPWETNREALSLPCKTATAAGYALGQARLK